MKKIILALMLCLGFVAQARASWQATYNGSYPNPTADELGLAPNVTYVNVTNPAAPVPVPQGLNWLGNPTLNSGYIVVPVSAVPDAVGQIGFYFQSAETHQHVFSIFSAYNSQSVVLARITYSTFDGLIRVVSGSTTILTSTVPLTLNATHSIVLMYNTTSATLNVDGATVTTSAVINLTPAQSAYALGDPAFGSVGGATNLFIDILAFSNNTTDSFPPAIPSPTPTFTVSPSSTVTPTFTVSPSVTRTGTPTSTITPTFTFTVSPTVTRTSTPTSTNTPSFTPSATPTATQFPTAIVTVTPKPDYYLLWNHVNISAGPGTSSTNPLWVTGILVVETPTWTVSPTNTFTVSPTSTRTNTFTVSPSVTQTLTITQTLTPTVTPSRTASPTATPTATVTPFI